MALTGNRAGTYFKPASGDVASSISDYLPVATGQTIFAGALVSNNSGGYLVEATDASGDVFVGIAVDATDGATTSNGGQSIRVIRRGLVLLTYTSVSQTDVDTTAYVVDDETVAAVGTTTNDVPVGKVRALGSSANTCWVGFNTEAL